MGELYAKHCGQADGSLEAEAAGLHWLAAAAGGVRVAKVISVTSRELVLERIHVGQATRQGAERFGRALAHTHAAGAGWFGCSPDGWPGPGFIGRAPMTFNPRPQDHPSWGEFYADYRVWPYVRAAVERHALPQSAMVTFDTVCERLRAGSFDVAQPGLVNVPVARIHGDLWSGNVLWDADAAAPTGAVLIDPAAHGGHAETDLAMLDLFGLPHLGRVLSAYHEVSPLADGWRERIALHQLWPLLVHTVLFGGGYGAQALQAAARYV